MIRYLMQPSISTCSFQKTKQSNICMVLMGQAYIDRTTGKTYDLSQVQLTTYPNIIWKYMDNYNEQESLKRAERICHHVHVHQKHQHRASNFKEFTCYLVLNHFNKYLYCLFQFTNMVAQYSCITAIKLQPSSTGMPQSPFDLEQ